METLTLLVGLLVCFAVANGRHFEDRHDLESLTALAADADEQNEGVKKHGTDLRHRRRRWQANYGYDYPPPANPYFLDRREYDRNQQDLMPRIVKLLEEIATYVRRPPPPPQPIYVPYPVPYYLPQISSCTSKTPQTTGQVPDIKDRFPEMEDSNQNWGFVTNEEKEYDNDGSRPISFVPLKPQQAMKRPAPKVEHGSSQADIQQQSASTKAPKFADDDSGIPSVCNAAILTCCSDNKQQQKSCFSGFGCGMSYDNGSACSSDSITAALESFKQAYSPVQ